MNIKKLIWKYLHFKVRRYYMAKYGADALNKLYAIYEKLGTPIWLEGGTLLGSYREHGYIPHDDDIDMAMYVKDFTHDFQRHLFDKGFTILRYYSLVSGTTDELKCITEITIRYKGLLIDIFFNDDKEDFSAEYSYDTLCPVQNKWKARLFKLPKITGFETIYLEGAKCLVPSNTKERLEYFYGPTFMVPDSNWHDSEKLILSENEYYGEMIGGWR